MWKAEGKLIAALITLAHAAERGGTCASTLKIVYTLIKKS